MPESKEVTSAQEAVTHAEATLKRLRDQSGAAVSPIAKRANARLIELWEQRRENAQASLDALRTRMPKYAARSRSGRYERLASREYMAG